MMIDLVLYRCRVGEYAGGKFRGDSRNTHSQESSVFSPSCPKSTKFYYMDKSTMHINEQTVHSQQYFIESKVFSILYIYLILFFALISLLMVYSTSFSIPRVLKIGPGVVYLNWTLSFLTVANIKVAYFYLIFYALPRVFYKYKNLTSIFYPRNCSRSTRLIINLMLGLLLLNFLLVGIVNPSLLNPGPMNLKVYYQNVQGLIPFYELDKQQPKLDETKIFEINSYVNMNKPHVIMLNETWLKKSVGDREVIEDPVYQVYRLDRSKASHPPDPDNPNKYRKYGGGVLIAFRTDIKDMEFKRLSARKGAELVAFEMTLDGKKFVFCTVYRVNNLGKNNHESILNTIST